MARKIRTKADVKWEIQDRRDQLLFDVEVEYGAMLQERLMNQARTKARSRKRIQEKFSKLKGKKSKIVKIERDVYVKSPVVMSEWKTLERVLNGCSLARWGDGEVKHMEGKRNVSQRFNHSLQRALWDAFRGREKNYLVAIPNVFNGRVFTEVTQQYIDSMRRRFARIAEEGYEYGSSYITRGDLNGYMSWSVYWSVISELWTGKEVVLVRGHAKRAGIHMIAKARDIQQVETPSSHAWEEYPDILKRCLAANKNAIFLLCVGPTASVLAHDLAKAGRHAVDIGHLGLFYSRCWGVEDMTDRQVWSHRPSDPGYIAGVTDR